MTGQAAGTLTILLSAGPDQRCDPMLAGRPAIDWLLDTVQALRPDVVRFAGSGTGPVRERSEARPALARALHAGCAGPQPGITIAISCRNPLLRPATIRQARQVLAGDGAPCAVLVRARRAACWWSDSPGVATAAIVTAQAGPDGPPAWPPGPGLPDARTLRRSLGVPGARIAVVDAGPVGSLRTDDPVERQLAETALYQRTTAGWQRRGVTIDDPATTRIDATVRIGPGSRIRPHTELLGRTTVGRGASIGPMTTMLDARAAEGCVVRYSVCERVTIGANAHVGPYCWLRSETRLGARTRAGSFVEIANSVIGDDTKIPHVAGLIGAVIGRGSNIAGLSGSANFDGQRKHLTRIGDHVSVGAGTILVAPVSVGDGAYTAAGSIITGDVPGDALAIARSRQVNIDGWAARKGLASGAQPAERR